MPPMCPRRMGYDIAIRAMSEGWAGNAMMPKCAIVLAAGLGTRMRPYNGQIPKPLIEIGGKPLIDYGLDRLAEAGVESAVVNVHHLADAVERHLASRQKPRILISDERGELLGTGGGIAHALPKLGGAPFFLVNSDTLWRDGGKPNFERLAEGFDAEQMDALLLLAPTIGSLGYEGRGDYAMLPDGRLRRRANEDTAPFIYAGAAILTPALFGEAPAGAFPLTLLFDRAVAKGRLFGLPLDGLWMHVGTPHAVAEAEAALAATA
jgi:N-acetyl-alpha-D-muramate 1-phosphate uridylyltransferase